MSAPRDVIDRLTAAQNAHDLEAMLACFHEDYRSEQPMFPARTFRGIDQVRENWSAHGDVREGHPDLLRSDRGRRDACSPVRHIAVEGRCFVLSANHSHVAATTRLIIPSRAMIQPP